MEIRTLGGSEGLHSVGGIFGEPDSIEVDSVTRGIDVLEERIINGDCFVGAIDGDWLPGNEFGGGVGVEAPAGETITGARVVGSN